MRALLHTIHGDVPCKIAKSTISRIARILHKQNAIVGIATELIDDEIATALINIWFQKYPEKMQCKYLSFEGKIQGGWNKTITKEKAEKVDQGVSLFAESTST